MPIKPGELAGQDRQLLAGIVADDPDLATEFGTRRVQGEISRLDEPQFRGIVSVDAKVVDRVPVDRINGYLFVIDENRLGHDRTGRHDVAIGQDQSTARIDYESGGLGRLVPVGIERTGS